MHKNPTDDELRRILVDTHTIAMVGASSKPDRASYRVMRQLLAAGYRVIPVNPNESAVLGQTAYASLATIPQKVDIVDVFRRGEATPAIADEAGAIAARVLWLQQGISNEEAAARAESRGLTVVMDACLGATHARLRIPPRRAAS